MERFSIWLPVMAARLFSFTDFLLIEKEESSPFDIFVPLREI